MTPPFAAEYAACDAQPMIPYVEEMRMIRPRRRARIAGMNARAVKNVPSRSSESTGRHSSYGVSSTRPFRPRTPAFATTISGASHCASIAREARRARPRR
jgi:hypothetical protein